MSVYWTTQVVGAELDKNEVLPLYHELYSQDAPDFKSENIQIIKAIDMVSGHSNNRGIWIIDRGGDRDILYDNLLSPKSKKKFVVRLVGTRNLLYRNSKELSLKLAYKCKKPYSETIIKEENGKEKVYHISYGYMPVKLPGHDDQLYSLQQMNRNEIPVSGLSPGVYLLRIEGRRQRQEIKIPVVY